MFIILTIKIHSFGLIKFINGRIVSILSNLFFKIITNFVIIISLFIYFSHIEIKIFKFIANNH